MTLFDLRTRSDLDPFWFDLNLFGLVIWAAYPKHIFTYQFHDLERLQFKNANPCNITDTRLTSTLIIYGGVNRKNFDSRPGFIVGLLHDTDNFSTVLRKCFSWYPLIFHAAMFELFFIFQKFE